MKNRKHETGIGEWIHGSSKIEVEKIANLGFNLVKENGCKKILNELEQERVFR